ncbi:Tyrosine-protein phosphatase non-receptor type 2 [Mactra antiquata]
MKGSAVSFLLTSAMSSQIEQEFEQFEAKSLWPQVYQKIKYDASLLSIQENHTFGEARKPENRVKNRYRDVSPYDHSRVVLQKVQDGDSDYINASIIEVPESNRRYILSQGPLEHTTAQFWQMIWEQQCKAIIMLNKVVENRTLKCHQYWPLGEEDDDDEMTFEESNLKVTLQEEQEYQHYVIRTFDLEDLETNEVREVYHFHYTTWPDFGVPSSPVSFLLFLDAVREKGVLERNVGPAVIHCSAGIGRSGTFCLVDSALVLVEKNGTLEDIDIQSLLISMRSYRMGLIQTSEQLKFSYMAIIEGGRKLLGSQGTQDSSKNVNNEDEAPPPPTRVESLSHNRRGKPPPPPVRSFPVDEESKGEPHNKRPKIDTTNVPQKPARSDVSQSDVLDSYLKVQNSMENIPNDSNENRQHEVDTVNNNPDKDDRNSIGNSGKNAKSENEGESSVNAEGGQEWSDKLNEDGTTGGTELRQRRQEERQKRREKTQDMINKMKEKQQKSETWKKRRSYVKPVAFGLTLLIGSYFIWKFFW